MYIANIKEGALRIQNKPLSLALFGKRSFTLCVVMQLWLNRFMYIKTFMRNEADEKPHLIYDKTTKQLTLQTNGLRVGSTNETSITLPSSFNNKRVVFWLTKKGTGGDPTVKVSVSNYSSTLTLSSALSSQSNCTFKRKPYFTSIISIKAKQKKRSRRSKSCINSIISNFGVTRNPTNTLRN